MRTLIEVAGDERAIHDGHSNQGDLGEHGRCRL